MDYICPKCQDIIQLKQSEGQIQTNIGHIGTYQHIFHITNDGIDKECTPNLNATDASQQKFKYTSLLLVILTRCVNLPYFLKKLLKIPNLMLAHLILVILV